MAGQTISDKGMALNGGVQDAGRCPPNLTLAAFILVAFTVPNFLLSFLFGILLHSLSGSGGSLPAYVGAVWGGATAHSLVVWVIWRNFQAPEGIVWQAVGWRWPLQSTIVWGAVAFGFFLLTLWSNALYEGYLGVPLQQHMVDFIQSLLASDWHLTSVIMLVLICLSAPIVEEFVFRGYIQSSLNLYMPAWMAIPLTSILFAAVHFDWQAFPVLLFVGLLLGILYRMTRSLLPPILLHAAVNTYYTVTLLA